MFKNLAQSRLFDLIRRFGAGRVQQPPLTLRACGDTGWRRPRGAANGHRAQRPRLVCQWRTAPATGRLECFWQTTDMPTINAPRRRRPSDPAELLAAVKPPLLRAAA
jgi:hypothetical protein